MSEQNKQHPLCRLLQQVAELSKENEQQKERFQTLMRIEVTANTTLRLQNKALTEQVERLNKVIDVQTRMLASKQFETPELDRLREERKELVEALRESDGHLPDDSAGRHISKKIQSLLSKFEVPNQS